MCGHIQPNYTNHTGSAKTLSLSLPGAGQLQITAPVPRFLSPTLSSTSKALVIEALTFEFFLISIGNKFNNSYPSRKKV